MTVTDVTIDAQSALWAQTGVFVQAGDLIRVTATDTCQAIAGGASFPPFGDLGVGPTAVLPRYPTDAQGFAASGLRRFCLAVLVAQTAPGATVQTHDALGLARDGVTQDGVLFFIAPNAGQVLLIFNDTRYDDNAGEFHASVATGFAPPPPPLITATGILNANAPLIRLSIA